MTTSTVAVLHVQRQFCIRYINTLKNLIDCAFEDETRIPEVHTELKRLPERISSFENYHAQIMVQSGTAVQEELFLEYDAFLSDVRYIETKVQLPLFKQPDITLDKSANFNNAFTVSHTASQSGCYARLPKLNLSTFKGVISDWSSFYDMFMSSVDNNETLQPVQKFQYLKSTLDGEPLSLIKNLQLTDANYYIALQLLEDRYARKRLISAYHLQSLINLSNPTPMTYQKVTQFVSSINEHVAALKAQHEPVDSWSRVLTFILVNKLDTRSRNNFERTLSRDELPELEQFLSFLDSYILSQQWQTVCPSPTSVNTHQDNNRQSRTSPHYTSTFSRPVHRASTSTFVTTNSPLTCAVCKQSHLLIRCPKFQQMEPKARHNVVRSENCCFNCLSSMHHTVNCKSEINCRKCGKRHHTLLHFYDIQPMKTYQSPATSVHQVTPSPNLNIANNQSTTQLNSTFVEVQSPSHLARAPAIPLVLLGTAMVSIADSAGVWKPVRALLDSGSEATYITAECLKRLNLPSSATNITVSGFSNVAVNTVQGTTRLRLCSKQQVRPIYDVHAIVVTQITRNLPKQQLSTNMLTMFKHLPLADPDFIKPAPIDLLIGADLYYDLITGNKSIQNNAPIALETTLGWIISGRLPSQSTCQIDTLLSIHNDPIAQSLTKFWEIEEIPTKRTISQEDQLAEQLFVTQHFRTKSGRYVVPLLFHEYPPYLGNSYNAAFSCYKSLQQRLSSNLSLQQEYVQFMRDYLDAGHMSLLSPRQDNHHEGFYLPHHGVIKVTNTTTKLRVVFNGSKRTALNISLNDVLLTGPALQADLPAVITRSRLHKFIFTADIRQMYRQVLVPEEHRIYQKILWNFDLNSPPQTYCLNTVTYGTSCAPYVAIRTLHQLANDEGTAFPNAAKVLKTGTYVDDVITGASTLDEAIDLQKQMISLLAQAGLELRKWTSNNASILANVPESHREQCFSYSSTSEDAFKILGLIWNPSLDHFSYQIKLADDKCTKRSILSEIAKVFDPLGWLTPTTMIAKRIMQELWTLGIHWDTRAPEHLATKWFIYKHQLPDLASIAIPRYIDSDGSDLDLIGFCDASEAGYAAVVYIRTTHNTSPPKISLIAAKSRVAPLKRISLPRLELCAALLLSRLIAYITETVNLNFNNIYAWSDSTVVLSWIRSPAYRWKTFVSNRVTEIQTNTPSQCWNHVRSQDNPADCGSRGILPQELIKHSLWWQGPQWLRKSSDYWPLDSGSKGDPLSSPLLEEAKVTLVVQAQPEPTLVYKYSKLNKLLRITAWCCRFINRCRRQPPAETSHLTALELDNALLRWVRLIQEEVFTKDINLLQRNQVCSQQIQRLSPFIDATGLLRVGGRLKHAFIHHEQKHPLLLPSGHRLTKLLVEQYHERYLHPSPRTLQALIERRFWILAARKVIRSCTSKCMKCFHCNPTAYNPIMGNLPLHRVTQLKPFAAVGVDYGGPFHITPYKGKGCRSVKAYLCLFVCFGTKALHLELASDLSTDAFLAAFRRFLSRRGRCSHIYSDAGTNFVGAKRYFTELQNFVISTDYNNHLANRLATEGIEWHLNPPAAPHFGGLWEAGIKSVKFHLSRIIGQQILTFEEFYTVICHIESILNSRPLCPMSEDPNDLHALTPNHFLTLEPAVCLPDRDYLNETSHCLTRWQLLQKLQQDFWKRWHNEYLNTLQQRNKWFKSVPTLNQDDLVLIKDNLLPPLQWRLGRVLQTHPGSDGVVRVAQVKTSTGVLTRPGKALPFAIII